VEDGGLFFWLIVFAIAVLQGIGQKKKKPGQRGRVPSGKEPRQVPQPDPGESVEIDLEAARPDATRASGPSGPAEDGKDSSEGMIPADVWAEILGLARGQPPRRDPARGPARPTAGGPTANRYEEDPVMDRIEAGAVEPAPEARPRPEPVRRERQRPVPERVTPPRNVPPSHTAAGRHHKTAPSDYESRLGISTEEGVGVASTDEVGVPDAVGESGRVTPMAKLFGTGTKDELRKAIIVKEVLGPPVGMK
jgi:hypothetical protein